MTASANNNNDATVSGNSHPTQNQPFCHRSLQNERPRWVQIDPHRRREAKNMSAHVVSVL